MPFTVRHSPEVRSEFRLSAQPSSFFLNLLFCSANGCQERELYNSVHINLDLNWTLTGLLEVWHQLSSTYYSGDIQLLMMMRTAVTEEVLNKLFVAFFF